jgi:hypothetical protein
MLPHELNQHLGPAVHVLGRVAAGKNENRHAELDIAQDLAGEVLADMI